MKKRKHRPPSRIRYEEEHPTVSFRVDDELKAKLDELRKTTGKSIADVLKQAVDVQGKSAGGAYSRGWNEAQKKYAVTYPCNVCGETIWVQSDQAKKAIATYMKEHGWGHAKCHERQASQTASVIR